MPGDAEAPPQRWLTSADVDLSVDPKIHEIRLPSGPASVVLDLHGTLWFTLGAANAIGRVRPDGAGYAEFALPTRDCAPRVIARGADGNMWFSEHAAGKVGRITPHGNIEEIALSSPGCQPRAVAQAADGSVWVALFASGRVARIAPTGRVTEVELPTPHSGPRALAAGSDGNVWCSEFKANQVARISPDGDVREFSLPRPNSGPGDITVGADGNLWLVELGGVMDGLTVDGNRIARVTPAGEVDEYGIPSPDGTPINIAAGPDGAVWYTKGATVGRVTLAGEICEFSIADEPARAVGLTAGSDRQPPDRLVNRLYVADAFNARIVYFCFTAAGVSIPAAPADPDAARVAEAPEGDG